jgi:hypothetical protein
MQKPFGVDPSLIVFLGLLGLWFVVSQFVHWIQFRNGASWPTTAGIIQNADIREHRTRSAQWFEATVPYSYEVNGKLYFGKFTKNFDLESDAREYKERLWGKRIVVRFNPRRVEMSLFTEKDAAEL